MATVAFVIGGIMGLVGVLSFWLSRRGADAARAEGQGEVIVGLEHKVGELENQLRDKWVTEARKAEENAKNSDLSSAIEHARDVLRPRS